MYSLTTASVNLLAKEIRCKNDLTILSDTVSRCGYASIRAHIGRTEQGDIGVLSAVFSQLRLDYLSMLATDEVFATVIMTYSMDIVNEPRYIFPVSLKYR